MVESSLQEETQHLATGSYAVISFCGSVIKLLTQAELSSYCKLSKIHFQHESGLQGMQNF